MLVLDKIKCPAHFMLKPNRYAWVMIPDPSLNGLSDAQLKQVNSWGKGKINRYIPKKDKFNQKIRDDSSFYQPDVTKGFAVEHVYNPTNAICVQECGGRCLQQGFTTKNIDRLKQ